MELLAKELHHLGAKDVVIQVFLGSTRDLRLDGMLRADAQPTQPGVVLCFNSKHGPMAYPCDSYTDWRSNVRAIALVLQALRAVDRHGVTGEARQYQGYASLPPAKPDDPYLVIVRAVDDGTYTPAQITNSAQKMKLEHPYAEHLYKKAVKRTHPDMPGGTADRFIQVQRAWEAIENEVNHG